MTAENELIEQHLEPGEKVLWSGPSGQKASTLRINAIAAVLAVALLWSGWSDSSPISSTLGAVICTALAIPPGGLAVLGLLDRFNASTTFLTSTRILNVNKVGGISPESGFPYDRRRECHVAERNAHADIDIPVVALDHGYPDRYSIGGLEPDTAHAIASLFKKARKGRTT